MMQSVNIRSSQDEVACLIAGSWLRARLRGIARILIPTLSTYLPENDIYHGLSPRLDYYADSVHDSGYR
jgi:hypothetical protein